MTQSTTPNSATASGLKNIKAHIEKFLPEMVDLRHDIHAHPELGYAEHRTSDLVASLLQSWGYEVIRGVGKTGVIGKLKIGTSAKSIGIRADMDALPIEEQTNLAYSSKTEGVMHACGHDGHTTTLLTAARYLAETKNFDGTAVVIFQPAEEGYAGAKAMLDDGLFTKAPCDMVFGLHNWPGIELGKMQFRSGPMMAACDNVIITIKGHGGHGAEPHNTVDPIVTAASMIMALQTVVSRNVSPLEPAIVTIGAIHGGIANNVIPEEVRLEMTVRTFSQNVHDLVEKRIRAIASEQAKAFGAEVEISYDRDYPVLINDKAATEFAQKIAVDMFGDAMVEVNAPPVTPSEDFAYMLEACPGSYLFIGNGESSGLHTPSYNFNDALLSQGGTYWAALVEAYLKK